MPHNGQLYQKFLPKYCYVTPAKCKISPHKNREIIYSATYQLAPDETTIPKLGEVGVKRFKGIFGALLYFYGSMDNKLLVAHSEIGSQPAAATIENVSAIDQLLDYVTIYTNDTVNYHASDMVLASYSDASYLHENKSRVKLVPTYSTQNIILSLFSTPPSSPLHK